MRQDKASQLFEIVSNVWMEHRLTVFHTTRVYMRGSGVFTRLTVIRPLGIDSIISWEVTLARMMHVLPSMKMHSLPLFAPEICRKVKIILETFYILCFVGNVSCYWTLIMFEHCLWQFLFLKADNFSTYLARYVLFVLSLLQRKK